MHLKFLRLLSTLIILLCFVSEAQKKRKSVGILTDSIPLDVVFNLYEFEGINKYAEYQNKQKMQRIYQLDRDQEWEKLFNALKDYVKKFGIQNFYKDTKLIMETCKDDRIVWRS